ncbi:DUF4202 family protein [Candidatus Falkowbacteria bacterium]|jgi:hypothetical protein|nr:DUF4202 family protein [Candidatus Falkowbacteria bacterium]MBT7007792.1 DUF4202 family protein [Candidatus Falkowbacteria bacterium]
MEGEQHFSPEKKERPRFLYHASANKGIESFEPRAENVRDPEEGPVVFATPDFALATTFLVSEANDRWTQIGKINDIPYMVIVSKETFLEHDKGGSIYKFSSDGFTSHPDKGMGDDEWVSKDSATPIEKIDIESALEAMIENGVQVFFVEKNTFSKIKDSADKSSVLKTLESENQRQGKNVVEFKEPKENTAEAFKSELLEILRTSRLPQSLKHAEGVLKWVKQLKPDSDLAMELASLGHDLDTCKEEWRVKKEGFSSEKSFKQAHAQKSAELLGELLNKHGLETELVQRVVQLVTNHEYGKDEDSTTIMQAEAISFFEYNLPIYFLQKGEARTRDKIKTMWSKLSKEQQPTVQQFFTNYDKTLSDYSHISEEDWSKLIEIINEENWQDKCCA